ncbi:hypothetical protein LBMAG49_27460 [Planctomycetota bacterium]|nr:hypothetical protein LBMAG49_27460 [Planctomycetota bacterium]
MVSPALASVSACLTIVLFACSKDAAPVGQKMPGSQTTGAANAPAKAEPFTVIDSWNGPVLTCMHNFATKQVVFHAQTPTAGYSMTFDGASVEGGKRKFRITLLQPSADTLQAQVVTDTILQVDEAALAAAESATVAVRCMQVGAHYLVEPAYVVAMSQQ